MEPASEYRKHGFEFKLHAAERLKDTDTGKQRWKAIYVAEGNIEVVILHETDPHPIFNPNGEKKLSPPSSEQWGHLGWTYVDLDRALVKFNDI
jgi:hypothetical protein